MVVGTAVHAICFSVLVWFVDWNLEAHKAAARVGATKGSDDSLETLLVNGQDGNEDAVQENA